MINKKYPVVNQKVKVIQKDGKDIFGNITAVFPPCETHSGRFIVSMKFKNREQDAEFWFGDYGESVIGMEK